MPSLYHYTDLAGLTGILSTGLLWASTAATSPRDVRYGEGQYLTDVAPGTMTPAQLSRALVGHPFAGRRFTHFVEIDVSLLFVVKARRHVFVVPNHGPLNIGSRILRYGVA